MAGRRLSGLNRKVGRWVEIGGVRWLLEMGHDDQRWEAKSLSMNMSSNYVPWEWVCVHPFFKVHTPRYHSMFILLITKR